MFIGAGRTAQSVGRKFESYYGNRRHGGQSWKLAEQQLNRLRQLRALFRIAAQCSQSRSASRGVKRVGMTRKRLQAPLWAFRFQLSEKCSQVVTNEAGDVDSSYPMETPQFLDDTCYIARLRGSVACPGERAISFRQYPIHGDRLHHRCVPLIAKHCRIDREVAA